MFCLFQVICHVIPLFTISASGLNVGKLLAHLVNNSCLTISHIMHTYKEWSDKETTILDTVRTTIEEVPFVRDRMSVWLC